MFQVKRVVVAMSVSFIASSSLHAQTKKQPPVGYDDTPMLPDSPWRVHDIARPAPPVVTPGPMRESTPPPADALVLFDGRDVSRWVTPGKDQQKGQMVPAKWKVENGYMEVNGTGSITTREAFGDCQLHLEWATPGVKKGASQGTGNSGVYLMGRYEIQVLDSYENHTYADGQAAALYGQQPPMVNACRKPGEWQSYDIIFEAPRFANGQLVSPAYVTVIHNGVVVHHRQAFIGSTAHKRVGTYTPHAPTGPIMLQDHGNPVRFRNIWVRPFSRDARP